MIAALCLASGVALVGSAYCLIECLDLCRKAKRYCDLMAERSELDAAIRSVEHRLQK